MAKRKTKQELIDEIMDNFRFSKVADAMQALDWKWVGHEDTGGVPEEHTLRKKARGLLSSCYDFGAKTRREYSISTGGFTAEYDYPSNILALSFNVDSWEAYDDDWSEGTDESIDNKSGAYWRLQWAIAISNDKAESALLDIQEDLFR